MYVWMDGWMDGWMNVCMYVRTYVFAIYKKLLKFAILFNEIP